MKLSQNVWRLQFIANVRLWLVLVLLAFGVMLALPPGVHLGDPDGEKVASHMEDFPGTDCGYNWFKFLVLPNGDTCYVNGQSTEKVDRMVEEDTPGIFDQYISKEALEMLEAAKMRVLAALKLIP